MRRIILAAALAFSSASFLFATADDLFDLTGWAEIPSTYRQPGPKSGQFTGTATVNGVTPPYTGQPIPGFSGVIPSGTTGVLIGLPDNGYGAQNNSADFVLGFYRFVPHFKTDGDGTTSRGTVDVLGHT